MSVVKKYRCRYFEENGTPIPPTCNQGEACRFVHPEDQNWPGLKPFQDTRLINKPSSKRKDTSRASFSSSDNRGAALASQSELFRCKVEGDEVPYSGHRFGSRDWDTRYERNSDSHERRNGHLGHRDLFSNSDRRRRSYSRTRSSSPRPRNTATGSMGSRKYGLDLRRSRQEISRELASNQSSSSFLRPASVEPPISKEDGTDFRAHSTRAERLVGLFKSLARLSNQVVQDTAACELQGQKLRTYTQISSEYHDRARTMQKSDGREL
ncbi:unnamed protein product [Mycena citricolor]|uniref:C3H1-type domain-containing protein n=1 Tax=Mycena citricolor TaxID=2018698 RepID=A0AAD2K415_9AGAR|nr:unnamed protein product [Mycena citricolor]